MERTTIPGVPNIDPQALAREMVVELDQPGAGKVKQLGVPVKLSRTPGGIHSPGPVLGEHTDEVLAELGYSKEEIAELRSKKVVGSSGLTPEKHHTAKAS